MIAASSALLGVPFGLAVACIIVGLPLSKIRIEFPEVLIPLAWFIGGAIFAGIVLLPFHKIRWYWAAVLGPLISFGAIAGLAFGWDELSTIIRDTDV